jgi:hypothetical protein
LRQIIGAVKLLDQLCGHCWFDMNDKTLAASVAVVLERDYVTAGWQPVL